VNPDAVMNMMSFASLHRRYGVPPDAAYAKCSLHKEYEYHVHNDFPLPLPQLSVQ